MFVRLTQSILKRLFLFPTPHTLRLYRRVLALPRFPVWGVAAGAALLMSANTVLAENRDSELLEEELERIVKQADSLFEENEFGQLLEFLSSYEEQNEPELLWRLSRAYYKVAVARGTAAEVARELSYKAIEVVNRSLAVDGKSFAAHKWAGITLSHIGCYEGMTSKIKQAYTVKSHFENALKLNANDPTSWHLLGQWCYTIAEISWLERRVVSSVLATPPTSSYQEAYDCFRRAEEQQPGFYSMNLLYLAKCLLKMNRQGEARDWLSRLASHRAENEEDERAAEEGRGLL